MTRMRQQLRDAAANTRLLDERTWALLNWLDSRHSVVERQGQRIAELERQIAELKRRYGHD